MHGATVKKRKKNLSVEFTFLPQGVWKYERVPWEKKGSS
jgi:hypothetical protein